MAKTLNIGSSTEKVDLKVTGTANFSDGIQAKSSASSSVLTTGSSGQVLKTTGSDDYWGNVEASEIPTTPTTLNNKTNVQESLNYLSTIGTGLWAGTRAQYNANKTTIDASNKLVVITDENNVYSVIDSEVGLSDSTYANIFNNSTKVQTPSIAEGDFNNVKDVLSYISEETAISKIYATGFNNMNTDVYGQGFSKDGRIVRCNMWGVDLKTYFPSSSAHKNWLRPIWPNWRPLHTGVITGYAHYVGKFTSAGTNGWMNNGTYSAASTEYWYPAIGNFNKDGWLTLYLYIPTTQSNGQICVAGSSMFQVCSNGVINPTLITDKTVYNYELFMTGSWVANDDYPASGLPNTGWS